MVSNCDLCWLCKNTIRRTSFFDGLRYAAILKIEISENNRILLDNVGENTCFLGVFKKKNKVLKHHLTLLHKQFR